MKKIFTICAAALMALCSTNVWADELTVKNDTYENNTVPIDGYNCEAYVRSQIIYPAADLAAMNGKNITAMKFYLKAALTKDWGVSFTISLKETTSEKYSSAAWEDITGATEVFSDQLSGKGVTEILVTFSTPFAYNGGNLLFDLQGNNKGAWEKPTFYGWSDYDNWDYHSVTGYSSTSVASISAGRSMFIPKTTFTYSEGGSATCAKPGVPDATSVGAHEATLNWSKAAASDDIQYALVEGTGAPADGDWSTHGDVSNKSYDNLKSETQYTFYIRTYCAVDDQSAATKVSFTTEKSCYKPDNFKALSVGATSAQVSWEDSGHGEVGYQCVHVAKDGVPDWNQAASFATGEFIATINGLSPLQSYDVYVRSVCAGSEYSEVAKININTPCGAIAEADLPWNEDFTGVTGLPDCWIRPSGTQPSVSTISGNKVLFYNLAAGNNATIALPEFANAIKDLTIELDYSTYAYENLCNTQLEVGYLTDANDASTFVAIGDAHGKTSTTVHVKADLATAGTEAVRIALRGTGIDAGYLVVDNIKVSKTPACANPKNLERTALTHNSASFAWAKGEDEEWYQYAVVTKGSAVGSWTKTESVNQHTATVGDLTTGTEYEFVLRSWCSDTKQGDEQRIEFTPVCAAPSDLAISNITHTSATIGWTANGATKWTIAYRRVGASTWEEVSNVTENPFSLSPLQSARDYQVKVKSTEPCISDYCSIETFTTKCAPKPDGDLPFTEDFESNLFIPDCWMVLPDGAQATVITMSGGDNNQLYMTGAGNRYLVLPEFEKALSELTLEFAYSGSITPEVGYLTAADGATFSLLETPTASPAKVDLKDAPDGAKYVAIHYTGTGSLHILYVDDVKLSLTSSTTGIEGVQNAEYKVLKTIENGQLILIRDGVKYNAQGAKL